MTPGHCFRAVRAAMFAAVCVLLATLGHVLMSGLAVPWWAVCAAFVGTAAAAWSLAGRERGPLTVIAATVAVQAALHSGFSLAQSVLHPSLPSGTSFARQWAAYLMCGEGTASTLSTPDALKVVNDAGLGRLVSQPPPGTVIPDAGSHAHHAMHGMAGAASEVTGTFMPAGGHDVAGMSPAGMLAAHLLAALLCGLWLAYGEQGAFRVLRAVAGWIWTPLRLLFGLATAPLPPRIRVRRVRRSRALPQLFLVHAITSRGPPTGTAVL
ncbi:hypothetical protein MTF65_02355 [Streptomyces sp. APSN-46.1]|uniref:hypothetical protein n=1 Tax=Streptomyces sp. APSN-46.1 TaxID=2929049 RepID=UPI001FB432F9|nr:hypothetical protein [Streptomyces sp. APSN-46.1]MCJ1676219.1 hypothetical protein [Streptomyces sp. APSN-46.1]